MINILLIDDSEPFREITGKFLERHSEITILDMADNGDIVLNKNYSREPDIILLDLDMPGKTGLELIPELRLKFLNSKIIVLTLMDGENYKRLSIETGADDFVTKHQLVTNLIPTIFKHWGKNREALD